MGGEAVKKSSVFEWHKQFKKGRENVEHEGGSGRPRSHRTDEDVEKVRNLMHSDRHLSIKAMTGKLKIDKETVKRSEPWPKDWIFHHDNAPAHKAHKADPKTDY
jgi:hypothetical protein